jgi:hypothetical protein
LIRDEDGEPRLVPGDEEEVRVVRWIFDKVAHHGWPLRRICLELQERGVKPPRGNGYGKNKRESLWHHTAIRRMIRNRKYVGDLSWNNVHSGKHSEFTGGEVVQRPKKGPRCKQHAEPDIVIVPDRITPLIDRETFRKANEVLERNQKATNPKKTDEENRHLFTHLLVCGHCGAYMVGNTSARGQKGYFCSSYDRHGKAKCTRNSIPEKPLRDLLVRTIRREYLNPDRLDELEKEMRHQLEEDRASGESDTIRRRLEEIEQDLKQASVNMARARSQAALDGIESAARGWNEEKDRLAKRLGQLKDGDTHIEEVIAEAERQLWQLCEAIDSADPSLVRAVLREVVEKVELFFENWKTGKQTRSRFMRGVIYVRPGVGVTQLFTSPR